MHDYHAQAAAYVGSSFLGSLLCLVVAYGTLEKWKETAAPGTRSARALRVVEAGVAVFEEIIETYPLGSSSLEVREKRWLPFSWTSSLMTGLDEPFPFTPPQAAKRVTRRIFGESEARYNSADDVRARPCVFTLPPNDPLCVKHPVLNTLLNSSVLPRQDDAESADIAGVLDAALEQKVAAVTIQESELRFAGGVKKKARATGSYDASSCNVLRFPCFARSGLVTYVVEPAERKAHGGPRPLGGPGGKRRLLPFVMGQL